MLFRKKPAGTGSPPAAGPADPAMDGARTLYQSILKRGGVAPENVGKYGIKEDDVLQELARRVREAETSADRGKAARETADAAYNWFMHDVYETARERTEKASQGPPAPDSPVPGYLPPGSEPSGPELPAPAVVIPLEPRSRFKLGKFLRRGAGKSAKPKKEKVTYNFESQRGANVYYGSDDSAILIPDSGAAQYLSKGTDLLTPLKKGRVMRGRFYGSKAQVEAAVEHLRANSTVFDAKAKATISRLKGKIPMDFETNWLGSRVIVYGTKEDLETVNRMAQKELDALWSLDESARTIKGPTKSVSVYGPPPAGLVGPPATPPPAPPMAPPPERDITEFSGSAPPSGFTPELPLGPPRESILGADPHLNDRVPAPAPPPEPAPPPLPPRVVRDLGREESAPLPPPPAYPPWSGSENDSGIAPLPPPPPAPPQEPVAELDIEPVPLRRNGGTPGEAQPADEDEDPYGKW